MSTAPFLIGLIEHPPDRGLQAGRRVADHHLQPVQSAGLQAAQILGPERFCLGWADGQAVRRRHLCLNQWRTKVGCSNQWRINGSLSRRPPVFTATAIIAATEMIRPP